MSKQHRYFITLTPTTSKYLNKNDGKVIIILDTFYAF